MKIQLIQYLTSLLLSLQPSYGDAETWDQRKARMERVAEAIEDAASKATCSGENETKDCVKIWAGDKKELAVLLVVQGSHESGFAKHVHEGRCRDYECDAEKNDNGKTVGHRARSPWQLHKTGLVTHEEYSKMKSSDIEGTKLSAHVAIRYLALGMKQCGTVSGALSIYAGVKGCNWSGSKIRVAKLKDLLAKSEKQIQEEVAIWKIRHDLRPKISFKPAAAIIKKPIVQVKIVPAVIQVHSKTAIVIPEDKKKGIK